MTWRRLYITVEGATEREFLKLVLIDHLAAFSLDIKVRVTITSREHNARGGVNHYETLRKDVSLLLAEQRSPDAVFSTMLDLYALPKSFPGWQAAHAKDSWRERVTVLEEAFKADLGDPRFIPYIQAHEFEALLYCDLSELQKRIDDSGSGLTKLQREIGAMEPEEINGGETTAPSKRIIKHVPIYARSKVRVGAPAAAAIGLPKLRERCPRFDRWIASLEGLERRSV